MTKPSAKVTTTPDMIREFARYRRAHPYCWGVLHVPFEDGNEDMSLSIDREATDEERRLVAVYNSLSPSQRRRLRVKAERMVNEDGMITVYAEHPSSAAASARFCRDDED